MGTAHFGSIAENEDALELLRVLLDLLPLQPDFLTRFQEVGTCPLCGSEKVQVKISKAHWCLHCIVYCLLRLVSLWSGKQISTYSTSGISHTLAGDPST